MVSKLDKRDRAELFRTRLTAQMAAAGLNRSAMARACGVDRSTIAQLLNEETARLPNAHLAAEAAHVLEVSADWLLGLSDLSERPGDVLANAVAMTEATRTLADQQLYAWQREAAGHKIRHVPATLPDVLKTDAILHWEYAQSLGRTPEQALQAGRDSYRWLLDQLSDYEIALPISEIRAFAAGAGYYQGIAPEIRRAQLAAMIHTTRDLYPSLRLFLYDERKVFSAPVTVFGPLIAVAYIGSFYLAFRSRDRVRGFADHFDRLVREADVDARAVPAWLEALAAEI